ncbi:MAG: hypothetical protein JO210_13485 [Acidobacteriaceae bacterium]|nr:hypothetical protein [Acidobacteriaceae bacterium]
MKPLLALLFLSGALYADSTVCSAGPNYDPKNMQVIPCSSLTELSTVSTIVPSFGISGNTVTGSAGNSVYSFPNSEGSYSRWEQVSASFNDTFAIQLSPKGDVYKIDILAAELGTGPFFPTASTAFFYGSASAGPVSRSTVRRCINDDCEIKTEVPADQITSINLTVDGYILVGPDLRDESVEASFLESITLERFKADGVTPDNFTPEPASIWLALCGLTTFMAIGYLRRNHRSQM